jgi:hypothetical protein
VQLPFISFYKKYRCCGLICLLLLIISFVYTKADNSGLIYKDTIFNPAIKTVQLYVDPIILSDPVIPLYGSSQLHFEFDDLDGDRKNYYYTLIHCNYDWTATDLSPFEYLTGFREQDIREFSFSFNTKQRYAHYELLFPNEDIKPVKSGNYILKIYLDNDPEQTVITRRFIVFDSKAEVVTNVHNPADGRYTNTHQEIDFILNYKGLSISNPISDIKILLMQNFRWDNAVMDLKPLFIKPGQLDYNNGFDLKTAYSGGKEFRYFDTRSVQYHTDRVADIQKDAVKTEVYLHPDNNRGDQPYLFHRDINGRFIPGIVEGFNQKVEPDYVWVNFNLSFDYPLRSTNIFIIGKLSDWELKDEFQMHYNPDNRSYDARLYLKQGYYEYELVTADKGADHADHDLLEGNSYETENTYQVFVYYRPFGSRYDEVIAYKATDSFNNNH